MPCEFLSLTEKTRFRADRHPKVMFVDSTQKGNHAHIMHKHDDLLEVVLIRTGHGINCVEGCRYQVEAGDIIIFNCGAVHDEIVYEDALYTTTCVAVSNLYLENLPPNCFLPEQTGPLFRKPRQFDELLQFALLLAKREPQALASDRLLSEQLLRCFLTLLCQMSEEHIPDESGAKVISVVEEAKRYLDVHYAENVSLEDLGRMLNISPFHLSHLFKQHSGYSFKQYVIRRRIGESQTLLENTSIRITDIAMYTGFGDSSHFNKIFTKHVGMTPTDYRRFRKSFFKKAAL